MSTPAQDIATRQEPLTGEALLRRRALQRPAALALIDSPNGHGLARGGAGTCSYAAADATVDALAHTFIALGLVPGDRILVQLPNVALQSFTILAAWRAGLTACMVPMLWRRVEIEAACAALAPQALLGGGNFAGENQTETLCEIAASHMSVRFVLGFGHGLPDGVTSLDEALEAGLSGSSTPVEARALPGPAMITFTARPGVPFVPVFRSEDDLLAQGAMTVLALSLTSRDVILCPYPLTGIVGLSFGLMAWLISGGVLAPHHPFNYGVFVQQLITSGATVTALPSSILMALAEDGVLRAPECKLQQAGCVWSMAQLTTGAPALDGVGLALFDLYPLGDLAAIVRRRAVGANPALLPHGKIRTEGADGEGAVFLETALAPSRTLGLGPRELLLRGVVVPRLAAGSGEPPAASLQAQGFVGSSLNAASEGKGGDLLKIRRDPELLQHGGFTIAAAELDALYQGFPGFLDAACFVLPDPIVGDRIFAAVVPKANQPISLAGLHNFLRDRGVAPYKFPDRLVVVTLIPREADGRMQREQMLRQV
jgi:acyl-CoA synthetase (AMP-forming)/AMP-acid ligase II